MMSPDFIKKIIYPIFLRRKINRLKGPPALSQGLEAARLEEGSPGYGFPRYAQSPSRGDTRGCQGFLRCRGEKFFAPTA